MARIVVKEDTAPKIVKVGEETLAVCMCGLSKAQPFCDGSHNRAKDEEPGKVYKYSEDARTEVTE